MTEVTPDNAARATPVAWQLRSRYWDGAPWSAWQTFLSAEAMEESWSPYLGSEWQRETRTLYSAATVTALEAEVRELRDSLDALVQAAYPMVTDDVQHERVIETTTRGRTSISIDPFPLMKFRPEDMRDLQSELERARRTLTGADAK